MLGQKVDKTWTDKGYERRRVACSCNSHSLDTIRGSEYGHLILDMHFLQIKRPYSFTSPFMEKEFVALIYAADENISDEERDALSGQIVASGCRYAVCAGHRGSSWDESIDMADILRSGVEVRDENLVMTTWHDDESLEDIVFFFLNNTGFDDFTAERFVVLFVGEDGSYLRQIQREVEKQSTPQRA
jgi:hypothetical protein